MKVIDIHTHGIGGYDTRTTDIEHILKIAEIHGSYGVDEIILTIYPATIRVMRENLELIQKAVQIQQTGSLKLKTEFSVYKYGQAGDRKPAKIIGVHLEGPFLNPLRCGSLNSMTFIDATEYNFEQLIDGFTDIVRVITIAPEIDGAARLIRKISDSGIIASMGHSDATYAEAEAGHKAGAKGVTHLFNAMRQFHQREPGIAGYGLLNPDIYVEVIPDPFHLHPATLEMIFRVKPAERIILISDSIKETKLPAAPVSTEAGLVNIHGRLLGGSASITEAVEAFSEKYDREVVLNCITKNPERYLYAL